jgi:hypothetical protein
MIKGLYQNTNPENIPKQYAWYAKNSINNRLLDSCINEKGNTLTISGFENYNIKFFIGVAVYGDDIILAYKTNDDRDQIMVFNQLDQSKVIKLDRTDFGFNQDYPLDIEVKYNAENEIVVVITDDLNPPRYVNLEDTTRVLSYYSLFPIYYNPSNIITEVIDSGAVLSGAYFIYIQYINAERTRTQFSLSSNPTYINDENAGIDSNKSTNKSIKITLKDVDNTYSKIAIAVLSKINGVLSAKVVREVSIGTATDITTIYSGNEYLYDVSIDTLLEIHPVYTKAKHVTSLSDQIFLADLEANPIKDYQVLANQTVIDWISELDTLNTLSTSKKYKLGNQKTLIHDEVYAIYQQFELTGGRLTDWFHIPGRELTETELGDSSIYYGGLQINGRNPKVYEVQDTCGIPNELYPTASGIVSKYGVMGGWQNSNETYPNTERWVIRDSLGAIVKDFRGKNVRHHKFPSIGFLAENAYSGEAGYGINILDRLGIKITNPLLFTAEYPEITGYRIGYAKRNLSEVGVVGMGLTILGASPSTNDGTKTSDVNTVTSSAGNFDIECLNGDPDDTILNKSYLRFNSFDVWQDRPTVAGTYLRNYIKLKANKLSSDAAGYNGVPNVSNDYGQIFPGSGDFDMVSYASNFTVGGANNTTKSFPTNAHKIRQLSGVTYIPNNIKVNQNSIVIDNAGKEETVFAKIEGDPIDITKYGALQCQTNTSIDDPLMAEEAFLASLKNPKSDFFLDFENQTIVTNPKIYRSVASQSIVNDIAVNGNFNAGLTGWSQVGAGAAWTDGGGYITTTVVTPTTDSAIIYQDGYLANTSYIVKLNINKDLTSTPFLVWLDSSNNVLEVIAIPASGIITISTLSPANAVRIGFKLNSSLTTPVSVTIDDVQIQETISASFNVLTGFGDGFIGVYSYAAIAPYNKNVDINATETERIVNFKIHVTVGRHNSNLRWQALGDYSTYFYPDAGPFTIGFNEIDKYWFYAHPRKAKWNNFNYSKDFSSINDLETYSIFNDEGLNSSNYPYRVTRSTQANRDNSLEDGWRTFKPLDYYDTVKNKGPITNLESWGDILLIHHRDALFRTRDKTVLQTTANLNVQLGSGDIFALEPQEQNPTKLGFAGTQHKFGCIVSDIGYIFPDASRGEIFIFNGQLINITKGLKLFFQNYLYASKDNPLNDYGISIAYDQHNYRILLSLKASSGNFVLSFDTIKQEWASFHDYTDSYLFNSKNELYSIKYGTSNKRDVYLHGYGKHGEFYGVIKPFFIDFVINDEATKQKVLASIQWLSKLYVNNVLQYRNTITQITIYNDKFTTGIVNILTNETDSLVNDLKSNTKIVDDLWSFDDIYSKVIANPFLLPVTEDYRPIESALNQNINWFEAEPIRGNYFIVRLEYSNLEDNEINIFGINALMRLSKS